MAKENVTEPPGATADHDETFELLHKKLLQLHAMLELTYGGIFGEEIFNMPDEIRENYMSACADMAHDSKELLKKLSPAIHRKEVAHV